MLSSIATIVCAAAMALSLSVEAGSFFRPSTPAATTDADDDAAAPPGAEADDDALADTLQMPVAGPEPTQP